MKKLSLLLAGAALTWCTTSTPAAAQQTPLVATTTCADDNYTCWADAGFAAGLASGGYYNGNAYWTSVTLEQATAYAEYYRQRVFSSTGTLADYHQTLYWDYYSDAQSGFSARAAHNK
jgi:hypothetical protein